MNILGIGSLELLVIFLVGFLVLGPRKSVEVSRKIGGMIQKIKTTSTQLANLVEEDDPEQPSSPGIGSNEQRGRSVDARGTSDDNQRSDI